MKKLNYHLKDLDEEPSRLMIQNALYALELE